MAFSRRNFGEIELLIAHTVLTLGGCLFPHVAAIQAIQNRRQATSPRYMRELSVRLKDEAPPPQPPASSTSASVPRAEALSFWGHLRPAAAPSACRSRLAIARTVAVGSSGALSMMPTNFAGMEAVTPPQTAPLSGRPWSFAGARMDPSHGAGPRPLATTSAALWITLAHCGPRRHPQG